MSSAVAPPAAPPIAQAHTGIHRARLFIASCFALIATSVAFAVVGDSMGAMKTEFVLNNAEVGLIGGAAIWGFTISIIILGPLCETLGMKRLMWFAFASHFLGVLVLVSAPSGFWGLFAGALIVSLGNGTVEAACNPLVATLYPDRKTEKLNQFHVWFPGGIVIGGLVAYAMGLGGMDWRFKIAAILVPTVIYGILLLGQKFPPTERAQSGVSFGEMFRYTFLSPLFILLFICMALTASMELGPNRWVPAVLQAGGIAGILVLVWINGLMAVLRFFAGPVVQRFSPTGILFGSSILAGVGLLWLSTAETTVMAFASGTVFALGVCYFWPTMLGVTSERVPRGGELALAMMGGIGMLTVGLITAPLMGGIADEYALKELPRQETLAVMTEAQAELPVLKAAADSDRAGDYDAAIEAAQSVIAASATEGELPTETANALRAIIAAAPGSGVAGEAGALLGKADNYGGRMSFRFVAPVSIFLAIVFGGIYLSDRRRGGYKAEKITAAP